MELLPCGSGSSLIARCDGKADRMGATYLRTGRQPGSKSWLAETLCGGRIHSWIFHSHVRVSSIAPKKLKEKYGIRAVRPLAKKTMDRIARGIKKFILDNPEPFLIQCNHGGERKPGDIRQPMPTITGKHGFGVVAPILIQYHSETTQNETRGQGNERATYDGG